MKDNRSATAFRPISPARLRSLSKPQQERLRELEPKVKAVTRDDFAKMTSTERAEHMTITNEYELLIGLDPRVLSIGK